MKGVSPQIGAMKLVFGEPLQGRSHIFIGNFPGLIKAFALGHFRQHAGDRDGRTAPEGLEFYIFYALVIYLKVDGHHISA